MFILQHTSNHIFRKQRPVCSWVHTGGHGTGGREGCGRAAAHVTEVQGESKLSNWMLRGKLMAGNFCGNETVYVDFYLGPKVDVQITRLVKELKGRRTHLSGDA
ncbi:hypothetical protein DPMN_138139 [Dreissena polymorpha]|uniref:Uncharacterized protein n=1 Tax=Dreissena polymorpha TaxID=45954 RepID=A0A9D4G3Q0_DREPO|nr:hypothetical protein DPMN_138139 [Dreissena polymorpha]